MLVLCFPRFSVLDRFIVFAPKHTLVLESHFLYGHVFKWYSSLIWVFEFDAAFLSLAAKLFQQVFVRIIIEPVLKFAKVTTSLLQLYVSALFLVRIKILIDFALGHLADVAGQDVLGQVTNAEEVADPETMIYSVLLSVSELIKH